MLCGFRASARGDTHLQILNPIVCADTATPQGPASQRNVTVRVVIEHVGLGLQKIYFRSALEPISRISGPTRAVEGAQGVGAVREQGARPVLALVKVRLLAILPAPAVVAVALENCVKSKDIHHVNI